MRRQTLSEQYFLWLYGLIGKQRRTYYKLCGSLHKKKFRWFVHNDDNRFQDGLNLRDRFIEEQKLDEDHTEVRYFLKGDCTVFELLVSLAQRINDLMYDLESTEDHSSKWFLEMVRNLGLDVYTDNYSNLEAFSHVTETHISDVTEKLVSREYDYYGNGGLFPLKRRPPNDQSREEIWYQLMLYLDENYGL